MSLYAQLSAIGLLAGWTLAVVLWGCAVSTGRLLLGRHWSATNAVETAALAGPWGLAFMVSVPAAIVSSGTSILTPVPLLQLALTAFQRFDARRGTSDEADRPPEIRDRPPLRQVALFVGAIVLGAQCFYLAGFMPYHGAGQWQMPFEDYGWWGVLSHQLGQHGIESWSAATIPSLTGGAAPALHWYHWLELWVSGLTARFLGLNAFLVLMFAVYPLVMGMTALAMVALLSSFVRWSSWNWALGAATLVVTSAVDPVAWLPPPTIFDTVLSILYYTNYSVGILYMVSCTLQVVHRRYVLASALMALAMLVAPPLLPLVVAAITLAALWSSRRALHRRGLPEARVLVLLGAGPTVIVWIWMLVSGHTLGPYSPMRLTHWEPRTLFVPVMRDSLVNLGCAVVIGVPYLLGLYTLWRTRHAESGTGFAVMMAASAFVACFPILTLGLVRDAAAGDASQLLGVMWAAFLVPLGWAGLCRQLVTGPHRRGVAVAMLLLAMTGISSTLKWVRSDVSATRESFSVSQVEELRTHCHATPIGYFSPESLRDREWWEPVESGWAALAECPFIRLNRRQIDSAGFGERMWNASAPATYARRQGIEWTNTADTMLGFARAAGIGIIAASSRHPIPAGVSPYLEGGQPAGPFTMYRIARTRPIAGTGQ